MSSSQTFTDASFNGTTNFEGTTNFTGETNFDGNVTGIDKNEVGLGNVDNTSDFNKPISIATQSALTTVQGNVTTLQSGLNTVQGNVTTLQSNVTNLQTGLTTAQGKVTTLQTSLESKISSSNPSFSGTVSFIGAGSVTGLYARYVGLGLYSHYSDPVNLPISTPTKDYIDGSINALLGLTAPETLNSFSELAEALGNNPSFVIDLSNNKVDKTYVETNYITQTDASNTYLRQTASAGIYASIDSSLNALKTDVETNYITQTDASNTYLRQTASAGIYASIDSSLNALKTDVETNYITQTDASNTYLRQTAGAGIYASIDSSLNALKTDVETNYITQTDASNTYLRQTVGAGIYASIDSPTFTGIVTLPAPTDASSNQAATTLFVKQQLYDVSNNKFTIIPAPVTIENVLPTVGAMVFLTQSQKLYVCAQDGSGNASWFEVGSTKV